MQNEESLSVKSVKSVVQILRLRLGALCQRSRFRESLSEAKSDKVMGAGPLYANSETKCGNVRKRPPCRNTNFLGMALTFVFPA